MHIKCRFFSRKNLATGGWNLPQMSSTVKKRRQKYHLDAQSCPNLSILKYHLYLLLEWNESLITKCWCEPPRWIIFYIISLSKKSDRYLKNNPYPIHCIKSKKFQNLFQKYPAINDDFRKEPFPQHAKHYPFISSQCITLLIGIISSFVYEKIEKILLRKI